MGDRNRWAADRWAADRSHSKTDPDATFVRLKEDHLHNRQLKPAYNVQISTSTQFIANRQAAPYSIHLNTTDTNTLASHLEQHEKSFGAAPKSRTADAGYGSEENYTLLEAKKVAAFVKYNLFDKCQNRAFNKKHPFAADKLYYDPKQAHYICPMGQKMGYIGNKTRKTLTGFEQTVKLYKAKNCQKCRLNGTYHKSQDDRVIQINMNLERQKQQVDQLLKSEGVVKRKRCCLDVEPVFGNIKHNHGFRRSMLRGRQKVEIEWGLIAMAQNIRKRAA